MIQPNYSSLISHWGLDRNYTFLNHGSFGAAPLEVLKEQDRLRKEMEAELVKFSVRELEGLWDDARAKTAAFLGAKASDLVFVKNTTMGVNTVFHSLEIERGGEVLMSDHTYGACANTIRFYAKQKGYEVKVAKVPFPMKNEDEVLEALAMGITAKTKLLFIDHITSATGTVFPVEKIVPYFKQKGIDVFIDGAHAPGQVDLDIEKLGADYYVGNCHKWICSPKGSAVLWVHPARQKNVSPLQVSHNYDRSAEWAKQFFWPGTDDYTAYLCIPFAIESMKKLFPGGWKELRAYNRGLTLNARKVIADKMGTELPVPDGMIGHLANVYLGKTTKPAYGFNFIHPVQDELFHKYKIEIPIIVFPGSDPRLWVRPACQCYNHVSQYEYLAEALAEIRKSGLF
ncbi:MAG TPA: aminotransferase class V-fold PLP-dependent enzyme [Bacteroidia bacterium]|jgi:isopenicillin-N epimerase